MDIDCRNIQFFPKQKSNDCGIQSIRSLLSLYASKIPSTEDIYTEFTSKGIVDDTIGLVYNHIQRSIYLHDYTISVYTYLPTRLLICLVYRQHIPYIVSIKTPDIV